VYSLPSAPRLNVSTFARLFSDTTNSYKHLFFQALLANLLKTDFKEARIPLDRIIEDICKKARYPISVCKLNFGKQDQMLKFINDEKLARKELLKYVPTRILSVFFEQEWRDYEALKRSEFNNSRKSFDYLKETFLREVSDREFFTKKPLYRFIQLSDLEVQPEWLLYIKENYLVIESWAKWHWLEYLQRRNPNVPSIATKLEEPNTRASLKKQTEFWSKFILEKGFRCIYSSELITSDKFELDHFLPWSFVGHDRIWNLVPVSKSANSSKSDSLAHYKYIKPFILGHYEILQYYLKESSSGIKMKHFSDFSEEYEMDLKVNPNPDLSFQKFKYNFCSNLHPMLRIASNSGFSSGWEYIQAKDKSNR